MEDHAPRRVRVPGDGRLPRGSVAVMWGHAERAATAADVLEAARRDAVAIVGGGPGDWAAATGEDLEVRP